MNTEREWRDLPPVEKSVEVPDEKRVSQTFMRTHDQCERSAYLDLLHEGGPGSHVMNRGSVFHRFAAKAVNLMIEQGENEISPEVAKELLREVYTESPELHVPNDERDALRAMVYHFAEGTWLVPENVIGVEQSFRLEIGEWTLHCKVDLAERVGWPRIDVTDYKTSFSIPSQAEFESDYQGRLYLLAIALGTTDTGLSLSEGVEEFAYRQRFPRYLREEGLAETEPILVTRVDLLDWKLDLEDQIARLEHNFETGRWQPTPGTHCSECVSPAECPLPRQLRPDSQMAVASAEDAEKLATWAWLEGERVKRARARLKEWSKTHGKPMIPIGSDLAMMWEEVEKYAPLDREKLLLEAEGAAEYGHPFEPEKYLRKRPSTTFAVKRVISNGEK